MAAALKKRQPTPPICFLWIGGLLWKRESADEVSFWQRTGGKSDFRFGSKAALRAGPLLPPPAARPETLAMALKDYRAEASHAKSIRAEEVSSNEVSGRICTAAEPASFDPKAAGRWRPSPMGASAVAWKR